MLFHIFFGYELNHIYWNKPKTLSIPKQQNHQQEQKQELLFYLFFSAMSWVSWLLRGWVIGVDFGLRRAGGLGVLRGTMHESSSSRLPNRDPPSLGDFNEISWNRFATVSSTRGLTDGDFVRGSFEVTSFSFWKIRENLTDEGHPLMTSHH